MMRTRNSVDRLSISGGWSDSDICRIERLDFEIMSTLYCLVFSLGIQYLLIESRYWLSVLHMFGILCLVAWPLTCNHHQHM